jgi:pimeloyl-ACP methyl ester carboxylesterase
VTWRRSLPSALAAVALVVASLAYPATMAAAGSASTFSPAVQTRPCGHRIVCGRIVVPRYWGQPNGHTFTIRFRIYRHTDVSRPPLEPLVGFEGGPGYPSIGSASAYLFLQGAMRRRHDLIVMDNRGTGTSGAIACRGVQQGIGNFVDATAACAKQLGGRANAYGTAAVADDMHALLQSLGIHRVDVYGDSYGSYTAQVFALRYPATVRAAIFDGTYNNDFTPFETEANATLRAAWTRVCLRAGSCPGILSRIGRFTRRLMHHPLVGTGRDADDHPVQVRLTGAAFAQLVDDATYSDTIFRDLPAAMRAYASGDRAPMLRLAAEDATSDGFGGSPAAYSNGDYVAVSCHDYPTAWDPSANLATRRAQLAAATAKLPRDAFAPFPFRLWLNSLYESELVRGCLKWPAPTIADPPFPAPGTPYPHVPVLVLNGGFDQATPPADARRVAKSFPNSTFVLIHNAGHVTAVYDYEGCASVIARRFLRTRHAGNTSCARRLPSVNVVRAFPQSVSHAPAASSAGAGDLSTAEDRQAAWVADETVGDAMVRWYSLMYGTHGAGLHGGSFNIHGAYLSNAPLRITFSDDRFVRDLSISGEAVWQRTGYRLTATLDLHGAVTGTVQLSCVTDRANAVASVTGVLDGRTIHLIAPVPWSP